jgi:hypothetical protein
MYHVAALRNDIADGCCELTSWLQYGPYGTFVWYGLITTPAANRTQLVGWGEEFGAQFHDAIIIQNNGVNYQLYTSSAGVNTTTNIVGQDWTVERQFQIVWAAGSCALYVNGALVATNNANVPSVRLVKLIEVNHSGGQVANTYVRTRGHL